MKALDDSTWAAFADLVERNNGVFGGCWCIGFHDKPNGAAANRRRKRDRVKAGTTHAALVFDGGHEWPPSVSAAAGELLARAFARPPARS